MIRPQTCSICKKELPAGAAAESEHFPFCTERCKMVDLYRWSEGQYAIIDPIDPGQIDPESLDPVAMTPEED